MSIAAIHTVKAKLRMSDREYRALLRRVAGVSSSRQLDPDGDRKVMAALRSMERSLRSGSAENHAGNHAGNHARQPAEAKIWALWYAVKPYLPEEERTVHYLLGFIARVIGYRIKAASCLPLLAAGEKYRVIEALKARLKQEEWTFRHSSSKQ